MNSASDQLRADLAALQNFIVALHVQATTQDDAAPAPPYETKISTTTPSASPPSPQHHQQQNTDSLTKEAPTATDNTVATSLRQLREELQTTVAQLHAERGTVAQLRIQQRCDDATVQRLADEAETTRREMAQLISQRDSWQQRCATAEARHARCAEHYESVRDQLEALHERTREIAEHHRTLTATAAELRATAEQLMQENTRLHEQLQHHRAELQKRCGVEVDLHVAQQRVCAFEQQQAAWCDEMHRLRAYVEAVKEEYVAGARLVGAMRQKHAVLMAGLSQREAQCERWEKLFLSGALTAQRVTNADGISGYETCNESPSPPHEHTPAVIASASATATTTEPSNVDQDRAVEGRDGVAAPSAVFVMQLEAKVADLAVQLYAAHARAAAAEGQAAQLAQLHVVDAALLMELKAMICMLRPQAESMAQHNAELQVRLGTAESALVPLMEHVLLLAEMYTEACVRPPQVHQPPPPLPSLSPSTSAKECLAPTPGPHQRSSDAAASSSPTSASGGAYVPGKRHRLRAAALLPRRHE
jgi:hypothetical protein